MDDLRRWVAGAMTGSMGISMVVLAGGVLLGLLGGRGLSVPGQEHGLLAAIGEWSPGGIVLLGILLLTLTPLAHVAVAAAAFARGGERRYLWIALTVVAVLLGSLLVAAVASRP